MCCASPRPLNPSNVRHKDLTFLTVLLTCIITDSYVIMILSTNSKLPQMESVSLCLVHQFLFVQLLWTELQPWELSQYEVDTQIKHLWSSYRHRLFTVSPHPNPTSMPKIASYKSLFWGDWIGQTALQDRQHYRTDSTHWGIFTGTIGL